VDRHLTSAADNITSAESTIRPQIKHFFIPLLAAVLVSISRRFDKQATEFMTHIVAFAPNRWACDASNKAVRELAINHGLDPILTVAQYTNYSLACVSPDDG
jgi:hypothetical protein